MVGIEVFTQHFKDFHESYIVIGGVACEDHFMKKDLISGLLKTLTWC